jgi:hypothetical protein
LVGWLMKNLMQLRVNVALHGFYNRRGVACKHSL